MMSKAKFMKKMAAVVIAGAMMTVMAVPVIAATSPIGKGVDGLKISKTLEKYENSYIPNTTFGFEIAPGVADPDNKVEVGPAGGVTFANGSTTGSIGFSSAKSDIGSKQETKDTALMVNASSFVEPGIYRYVIKETSTSGFEGIAYSTEKKILDIYKYSDDSFDYRFFDEATGDKLSEANFTNTYNHAEGQIQDLTVSKTVTGKLGNLSKEFAFNIAINSSNNDEVYYVTKNGETAIEQWNGSSTAITLKSGDSVTIYGLSVNDSYTITEVEANANGYTTSIANAGSSKDGTATGKITTDTNVSYTNTKDATPPMGIVMDIAPYAIMVAAAFILGFAFFRVRHYGKK